MRCPMASPYSVNLLAEMTVDLYNFVKILKIHNFYNVLIYRIVIHSSPNERNFLLQWQSKHNGIKFCY